VGKSLMVGNKYCAYCSVLKSLLYIVHIVVGTCQNIMKQYFLMVTMG